MDDTDGATAETGLTISQADVQLSKNGAAFAQKNDSNSATHDANGWYRCALDTTDTNTLGRLIVAVSESGALPVWREFTVLPANVFDSLIGGSDSLQVDAVEVSGDATAADNLELIIEQSRGVALMDDAITAGKFDESTAFPLVAADAGATAVARSGADSDTLEILSDQIDAIGAVPSAADVADAVWEEILADHTTEDSIGNVLNDITEESGGTYRFTSGALAEAPTGDDTYQMYIDMIVDDASGVDRWAAVFYKNGGLITSGITSVTLTVVNAVTESNLLNGVSMTQIASTGRFRYWASSNRVVEGTAYIATVAATIDSSSRSWSIPIGRDSQD